MAPRPDSYWVGHLATTVAISSTVAKPHALLKATLKDFLDDRAHTPLGVEVRRTMKEER